MNRRNGYTRSIYPTPTPVRTFFAYSALVVGGVVVTVLATGLAWYLAGGCMDLSIYCHSRGY